MNTARTAIVAIDVPAHVSDQALADRLLRILRYAALPDDPALSWPDRDSVSVTVFPFPAAEILTIIGDPS